jgi:hypothetical protein
MIFEFINFDAACGSACSIACLLEDSSLPPQSGVPENEGSWQ